MGEFAAGERRPRIRARNLPTDPGGVEQPYREGLRLARARTALGEQHPDFANSLNNLAELYRTMGRHAEAAELENQTRS